jgi:hypothetical protein
MKDIQEILRIKEQQVERLQKDIEALRSAIRIMNEAEVPGEISTGTPSTVPSRTNGAHVAAAPVKHFP